MLAAAAVLNWDIEQLGLQNTSPNAATQKEAYVKMAPGYDENDPATGVPLVVKLKRLLYGLRRGPLNWV